MTKSARANDPNEIQEIESDLLRKGYRLVNKTNTSNLEPYEYVKNQWSGTQDSFEGPVHYEIFWWVKENIPGS